MRVHRLRPAVSQRKRPADSAAHQEKGSVEGTAPSKRSRILYLDHVEGDRRMLFEQIVKNGSGGHRLQAEGLTIQSNGQAITVLIKVKNSHYSRLEGREGLFGARERRSMPVSRQEQPTGTKIRLTP